MSAAVTSKTRQESAAGTLQPVSLLVSRFLANSRELPLSAASLRRIDTEVVRHELRFVCGSFKMQRHTDMSLLMCSEPTASSSSSLIHQSSESG